MNAQGDSSVDLSRWDPPLSWEALKIWPQVSPTKWLGAPYSKIVLTDSCLEFPSLCIWRSQCPQTNATCHHHSVVSNLCIPIENEHIKMAQILFQSKTRHSWCPGLEVVSDRGSCGILRILDTHLLRWQLMQAMTPQLDSRLHLIYMILYDSAQKLPEAARSCWNRALRHQSRHLCMVHLMLERLTLSQRTAILMDFIDASHAMMQFTRQMC